jgi:hypothetical protein
VVLLVEPIRKLGVERQAVGIVAELRVRVRQEIGLDPSVEGLPCSAPIAAFKDPPVDRATYRWAGSRGSIWIEWRREPPGTSWTASRIR